MLSEEMIRNIRKYAIKNAMDYGRAKPENVIGKVMSSVKTQSWPELRPEVDKIVNEVNSLSKANLESEYEKYRDEFREKYEKTVEATSKPRMELDGAVVGNFATRFAPEPSGYLHIGHASAAFLAQEFSKIYKGKVFLYFDDTNPERETQEFVDACKSDLDWMGIKFDKEYYASDNMQMMYDCARKLISADKAYACECSADEIKKNRFVGKECIHRNAKAEENLGKFEMMLSGKYDEEKIVIRLKADMESQNTAIRDPTILRIKKKKHYKQGTKYVVWPTYDFNTPINDSVNGITDAIRTKEYNLRGPLYDMVLDYLGMRKPRVHLHARIKIKGQPRQKREIRKLIEDKNITGYDDPRLVTISALRRRGVQPEAIKEFVLDFGMSNADSVVDISPLFTHNRRIIDNTAKRLYYVPGPVDVELNSDEKFTVKMKLNPSADAGIREYDIAGKIYISGEDASGLKDNDVINLKDLFSLEIKKGEDSLVGTIVEKKGDKRLQWVSEGNFIKGSILVPGDLVDEEGNFIKGSLRTNEGYIESYASNLKERDIVLLERFGFCILDNRKSMQFIFISK